MPIPKKLLKLLDKNKIKHQILKHKKIFTAYDAAQTLKEDLSKVVKSLLVKADRNYYVVSLPANMNLDFKKLTKTIKAKKVSIPKEKDMIKVCKVKPGAMGAFGSLYKLPVLVDKGLLKAKDVVVSTGDFMESLRLKAKDYADLESAVLGNFGEVRKVKPGKKIAAKKSVEKASKKKVARKE